MQAVFKIIETSFFNSKEIRNVTKMNFIIVRRSEMWQTFNTHNTKLERIYKLRSNVPLLSETNKSVQISYPVLYQQSVKTCIVVFA